MDGQVGKVVDLRAARSHKQDLRAVARDRFAAARRSTGLTLTAFAGTLTETLGWPVSPEAVQAWESTDVPPGDVLLAADQVTGRPVLAEAAARTGMRLVDTYADLQAALAQVVEEAEEVLAVTGSRSRDPNYLGLIEAAVTGRDLTHYRVLYGPPRHGATKNHLLRLFDLHRPGKVHLGAFWDLHRDGERFVCASEKTAVIVLPSANSLLNFDTALVMDDPSLAAAYVQHVEQAFLASQELTERSMIEALEVLR